MKSAKPAIQFGYQTKPKLLYYFLYINRHQIHIYDTPIWSLSTQDKIITSPFPFTNLRVRSTCQWPTNQPTNHDACSWSHHLSHFCVHFSQWGKLGPWGKWVISNGALGGGWEDGDDDGDEWEQKETWKLPDMCLVHLLWWSKRDVLALSLLLCHQLQHSS